MTYQIALSENRFVRSRTVAECDFLGNGSLVLRYHERQRVPNHWIRFWMKFFFNAKWTFHTEDNS